MNAQEQIGLTVTQQQVSRAREGFWDVAMNTVANLDPDDKIVGAVERNGGLIVRTASGLRYFVSIAATREP